MNCFDDIASISIRKVVCENCDSFANIVTRHNHEMIEINLVLSGNLHFIIDGKKYVLTQGQSIVVNPFSFHSAYWGNCEKGEFISLVFNIKHFLSQTYSQYLNKNCECIITGISGFKIIHKCEFLENLLKRLLELYEQRIPWKDCLIYSSIYELMSYLFESYDTKAGRLQTLNPKSDFLRETSNFIQQNYTKSFSTSDIAAALYMSPSVFCRKFKQNFGTNFTDYLCEYRINTSIELKRKSQLSLTEIAYSVGFSNYGYFTKMFKKYVGTSPAVYFGKWKNI